MVQITEESIRTSSQKKHSLNRELSSLDGDKIDAHLEKYNQLAARKASLATAIVTGKLAVERADNILLKEQAELEALREKNKIYKENKEAIENLKTLIKESDNIEQEISKKEHCYDR